MKIFGTRLTSLKGFPRNGIDIFFINTSRKMIYHLYDDRGCDVIASRKEDLLPLYHELNEWIPGL
ncbi:DUF3885 domain-containing protein [Metabacillus indicus]|uniref:DUF3885 domain-containing protein n=1 Tax=Metabacillus indicus TaxID=246786 RepID=UPI000AD9EDB5|nr:DUF3885 domain-containing protein [Metabacillus indicus]